MPNPFLTLRLAFLGLMVYMNLVLLIFASWNVRASAGAELGASSSSAVLILSNCLTFLAVATSLAELLEPNIKLAVGWFECLWTVIVGNLQIAAAIGATVDSSVLMCRQKSSWGACASGSLLVPTAWITGIITVLYSFILLSALLSHRKTVPHVWKTSIYVIPWFSNTSGEEQNSHDLRLKRQESDDMLSIKAAGDLDPSFRRFNLRCDPPTWAQSHQVVRGRQAPFAKPPAPVNPTRNASSASPPRIDLSLDRAGPSLPSWPGEPRMTNKPILMAPPPKVSAPNQDSRPRVKEAHQLQRSGSSSWHGSSSSLSSLSMFPEEVDNHDLPIPQTRVSQWIRADTPPV